jgi:hypothetical protein
MHKPQLHQNAEPLGGKENQAQKVSHPLSPSQSTTQKRSATSVTIKVDCGFGNELYIRGDGAGLSWSRGVKLRNIDANTWVWESDRPFTQSYFKVLINDEAYENGENHFIKHGSQIVYTPSF